MVNESSKKSSNVNLNNVKGVFQDRRRNVIKLKKEALNQILDNSNDTNATMIKEELECLDIEWNVLKDQPKSGSDSNSDAKMNEENLECIRSYKTDDFTPTFIPKSTLNELISDLVTEDMKKFCEAKTKRSLDDDITSLMALTHHDKASSSKGKCKQGMQRKSKVSNENKSFTNRKSDVG